MKKYSVYPIELFCSFAMDERVRGAAWYRPLNLAFWVVRSEPPFVLCPGVHVLEQNAVEAMKIGMSTFLQQVAR